MLKLVSLFVLLASALACGQFPTVSTSHLQSSPAELLENDPIKLQCWAMSKKSPEAVEVDYDDQADIRICLALQKDGNLGVDLRYRPDSSQAKATFARLTVRTESGAQAQELFPLSLQRLTQTFEVYLSNGCTVAGVKGCIVEASEQMRQLFRPIHVQGDGASYAPFTLELSLLEAKTEKTLTSHPPLGKSYRIAVAAF